MSHAFAELTGLPEAELRSLWRRGTPPPPGGIEGLVFRGRNTAAAARFGPAAGAFAKGFFRTGQEVDGCNFPVAVRGGEWQVDVAHPFGFFRVEPNSHPVRGQGPPAALLLDYGRGRAASFRRRGAPRPGLSLRLLELAARPLRDLLVQPPDSPPGVLLGRAYFTGTLLVPVSFFVLEALQPLTEPWAADPAAAGRPRSRAS